MNLIYDDATLAAFRDSAPDAALLELVERLVAQEIARGLWQQELSCLAIQPEGDLAALLGAEPEEWDWRVEHEEFVEFGMAAGNSGFAWIIVMSRHS